MAGPQVVARASGQTKVKRLLARTEALTSAILAKERLEALLLRRTKDRFKPVGSAPTAQRDPSGRAWVPLSPETRGRDSRQKLVDTSLLLQSIAILNSNMSRRAMSSPTGGGFRIGVPESSPAALRARVHNLGATTSKGVRIPQRRFLGIGSADVKAVDGLIRRERKKAGI